MSQTVAGLPDAPAWAPATGMLVLAAPPVPLVAVIGLTAPAGAALVVPALPLGAAAPALPLGAAVEGLVVVVAGLGLELGPEALSLQAAAINRHAHARGRPLVICCPLTKLRWA
jgi:hypothetical protein